MGDHAWLRMPWLSLEVEDVALLEVGVDLQLVDGRDDGRGVEQCAQVVDQEVADADGTDTAVSQELFPGRGRRARVLSKPEGRAWCRISRSI